MKTYNDFWVGVEVVMWLSLTENLVDVDVHSSIVAPIICQCDNETDAIRSRGSDDVVLEGNVRNPTKARQCRINLTEILETSWTVVDGRYTPVPELVIVSARSGDLIEAPDDLGRQAKWMYLQGILAKSGRSWPPSPQCFERQRSFRRW